MRREDTLLERTYETREWRAWRQRRARRLMVAAGSVLLLVCAVFAML